LRVVRELEAVGSAGHLLNHAITVDLTQWPRYKQFNLTTAAASQASNQQMIDQST
jgi:hypothetical protein